MSFRIRRRRLPHIDIDGATYFVTSCLADSIPAQGLLDLDEYERALEAKRPENVSDHEWRTRCWKLVFARADAWLDNQPAVRYLADQGLAEKVVESMYHFAGIRYDLLAFVVMPSHFHWVFKPIEAWTHQLPAGLDDPTPRQVIMHSLKRFTARQCNELLGRAGTFWQDESYDHCVRDDDELLRIIEYVEMNPVKARLAMEPELWAFSSAQDRKNCGVAAGLLLPQKRVGQVCNLPQR